MSQTVVIVALCAVAVVSAVLSFAAWWLLARPPGSEGNGREAEEMDGEAMERDADRAEPT